MKTGEIIKALRETKGMTQAELAEKAGYRTRSSITKIESGVSDPSQNALKRIAKALDVKPGTLIDDLNDSLTDERAALISLLQSAPEEKLHLLYTMIRAILEAQ